MHHSTIAPKHDRTKHFKFGQVTDIHFWIKWTVEKGIGVRVISGGEGHRVVHKVHQNASKYTKMHQNCHQIMIEQSILNFTCSLIHSSADGVAHEDNS